MGPGKGIVWGRGYFIGIGGGGCNCKGGVQGGIKAKGGDWF